MSTVSSKSPCPTAEAWTCKRLLEWTTAYLEKAGLDQARLYSEMLLGAVLDWPRIQLYTTI